MKTFSILLLVNIMIVVSSCHKEEVEFSASETQLHKTDFKGKPKNLPPSEEDCFYIWYEGTTSNNPGISPRATVNFQGKLWALVLNTNTALRNRAGTAEIWSSSNGKDWTLRKINPFISRKNASLVVHNGRIWMMGGVNGFNQHLIDIWSSANGIDWELEALAPFNLGYLGKGRVTTFQNKIFVFTTWYQNNDVLVYSSSNGKHWDLETANLSGTEYLIPSHTFVLGNELFAIGPGNTLTPGGIKIFSTTDGSNWRKVEPSPEPNFGFWHHRGSITFYKDLVWFIGGYNEGGSTANRILYTSDMRSWTQYRPRGKFGSFVLDVDVPLVYEHTTIPFNGELLIFGGKSGHIKDSIEDNLEAWTIYEDCIEESK